MRSLLLLALGAVGALATGCCPAVGDDGMCSCKPCGSGNAGGHNGGTAAKNGGNFDNSGASHKTVVHATHTWSRISPSDVAASLAALAHQSPAAVSMVQGAQGGQCSETVAIPTECTSLGGGSPSSGGGSGSPTTGSGSGSGSGGSSSGPTSTAAGSSGGASSSSPAPTSTGASSTAGSSSAGSSSGASSSGSSSGSSSAGSSAGSSSSKGSSSSQRSSSSKGSSSSQGSSSSSKASSTSSSKSSSSSSTTTSSGGCTNPTMRVEWRNMNSNDKSALMTATQCLMTTSSRSGLPGCQSRWDDLVAIHQNMAPSVHQVGAFLVWHRQFIWIYEKELRETCGYTGALPWWDETRDAGDYSNAPMMTSSLYGSAPRNQGDVCINNGAFAGITLHIGPGSGNTDHCMSRDVNEDDSSKVTQSFVNSCNSYTDYREMNDCSYYGPHAYTHDAIGGSMSDVASSPNDPLFYLHHGFIDRNYKNWQNASPKNRVYAIGGWTTQDCEYNNGGSGCVQTTVNDRLSVEGFFPDIALWQAQDTQGGHLCYYYDY